MADWRTKFYGQHYPQKLKKIQRNLEDLKAILSPEESLLDVGCNAGHVYGALGHENYEGVDLDIGAVQCARETYPGKFRHADLFSLAGRWDVVLASRVLMHVPAEDALRKLLSLAKKYCVVFAPIDQQDVCQLIKLHDDQLCYFRKFSEHALRAFGDCTIHKRDPYSTVIYGPLLP